jgi:hypothetical protein
MQDLVLPDDISYGEAVHDFGEFADTNEVMNSTDVGVNRAYVMNLITACDSQRMRACSPSGAEASNTQSVIAQMNNLYTSTSWGSGNSLRIVNKRQVQNANMGSPTSNLSIYLPQVATYKGNNHRNEDNVQGFTSNNSVGSIANAYHGTMCQTNRSCGINNLAFTSSISTRGILVAHQTGHNFAMNHDDNNNPSVMASNLNSNAQRFSDPSVNDFIRNSPKGCL